MLKYTKVLVVALIGLATVFGYAAASGRLRGYPETCLAVSPQFVA